MYKLLLADDSTTIQRVIELTFSGEDVDVVAVGDGEQAIARIPVERPDIVLADIGMPKRSGYEVSAFVKGHAELSHIPVLLLAGAFEPVDDVRAEQVRCDGVLVKPFEPQQVIARVLELISGNKGSPSAGIGSVPRPVERLAPGRPSEIPRAAGPVRAAETTASPEPAVQVLVPPQPSDPLHVAARMSQAASSRPPELEPVRPQAPAPAPALTERQHGPVLRQQRDDRAADRSTAAASGPATAPAVRESISAMPTGDSLEDYFDRLDAAFATLGNGAAADTEDDAEPDDAHLAIPTLDRVLGSGAREARPEMPRFAAPLRAVEPPAVQRSSPAAAPAAGQPSDGSRSLLAQAFNALLAVEEGEPNAGLIRLSKESPPPVVTEAMVEEVTRRVLLRLSPDSVRGVVADIVSEIAERLVREEIQRIRNGG